jgi:DNA-binding MarR family transcriptional regulator
MAAPPAGQPPDLMHLLTRAERLTARRLTRILDDEGWSLDAWRVVSRLADGTGHPMTELAEHAFLPPATLTKLVDHLVDVNVVYRRVDDLDRRRIRAYLTPRGHTAYQRISQQIRDSIGDLALPDHEQESLKALLAGLVEALEGQPASTGANAG